MKFREINKKLREAQYFTLAGKPIEKDADIRDALHDILGVGGDNSVEAIRQAVEMLAAQKSKSRLTRQLLNDLEMIVRKFSLPLGRFHYLTLQKALGESKDLNEEILDEVEMSPSAFQKFLKSDAAKGIRAGFEAELIFRDTQHDGDGGEPEPDWDMDERAYDIQGIIDFFRGGESGLSSRGAERLSEQLNEQFYDWVTESFSENYFDMDRYMSWVDDNIWPEEEDNYREQARDALGDEDISDEELEKQAVQLFRDDAERDWDRSGDWYDRARDELYEEYSNEADQADWLDESGLRYMSDISNEFSLDWPHWTGGGGNGGERDWQDIADGLERATGKLVRVSSGYHGTRRGEWYVLEPDSSLDADDSEDYGLEVVSPPMPLPEAIEQLNKIIDWAGSEGDAYTNSSTGIHMGVSLPFKGGDVDPVKLILFMGDRDLLEKFDRASNYYTRSAYERLQNKIKSMKNAGPKQIESIMELMKSNLIELADRELKRGVLGEKYLSVHPQDGYIEFRGPGGDYLNKESEIEGTLENTMLRLAYAMSIAGSPDLYRKEYAKKLYKVLSGYKATDIYKGPKDTRFRTDIETEGENPFIRLFADYSAGAISGDELKRQWAETVLQAEQGDEDEDVPAFTPDNDYDVYDPATGKVISVFHADNDEAAIKYFDVNFRPQNPTWKVRVHQAPKKSKAPPSRRAELAKNLTRSTRDVGEQLWRVNYHSKLKFVTARSQAEAIEKASKIDRDFGHEEARARLADEQEKNQYRSDQEREKQRAAQPQGEWTGQWLIKNAQGRVLHRFGGIGNSQHDANRFAAGWLGRNHPELAGQEVEVVPEMPEMRSVNALPPGESDFMVTWDEFRTHEGREVRVTDGLRITARNAAEAARRVHDSLQMQGREAFNVNAEPTDPPPWRRNREMPSAATDNLTNPLHQLEWSGRWLVRSTRTGETVHRLQGIGNVQADANRIAAQWARSTGFTDGIEVVPEMQ